jgi:recombinational DNA repair protein (RecF pathway)
MASATVTDIDRFERVLLRRGVGVLTADRNRCADCGRTPLLGERVHLYGGAVVCELCRSERRDPPLGTETVRHSEDGHGVRLAARAA